MTLLSLGTGLESEIRKQSEVLGAELVVTPKGWCAYEQISVLTGESLPEAIPNADVEKVARIEGITAIPYLVQRTAIKNQPVTVVGILPARMKKFKSWEIDRGEYLLDAGRVVVGFGIAKQFEMNPGDVLTIRGTDFHLNGILKELGNRDDLAIYMDLPVAQKLYQVVDKVSFIAVKVHDIAQIDKYILEIQEQANVAVEELDLSSIDANRLAEVRCQRLGFVFQFFNLLPILSVLENVEISMMLAGVRSKEQQERARELLSLMGLEDKLQAKPNQLSGGQRQRVAIARAMANDPDILLMDEPSGNLDSKSEAELLNHIQKVNHQGKTVIIITHSQTVAAIAQRIFHIQDGRII